MRWLCPLLLSACGDYCEYSETICDGDGILECVQSDGFADHSFADFGSACEVGEVCIDTVDAAQTRRAECSLTGVLVALCAGDVLGFTRVCAGVQTTIDCSAGYASNQRACDGACVVSSRGSAFSSVDHDPSPPCEARESCEPSGDAVAVVACREGYVTDRIACDPGDDCVRMTDAQRRTYCVTSEPCSGTSTWCALDGEPRIEGCVLGRVAAMTCTGGTLCEVFGVLGSDNRPTGETQAQCLRR